MPDSPAQPHAELLEAYATAHRRLMAELVKCPRTMWQWKPAPDRWSIHENIIHLADAEAQFHVRLRHALAEPGTRICAFDQDQWAAALNYHAQDPADALEYIRLMRKITAALLETLPAEAWERSIDHPERGPMTAQALADLSTRHIEMHIAQIQRTCAAWQAEKQAAQA